MRPVSTLATLAAGMATLAGAQSAQLQQVSGFSAGPTRAQMFVYLPPKRAAPRAPILLAIHYCTGTAQQYFQNTPYARAADQHGFIVVYPSSPNSGTCWDVASAQSLTHRGGGDSETIVNMVAYAVANYAGDPDRVYATGTSSGAMMTNVLAGAYPDVIRAGSAYSGVPDGCFFVQGATPATNPPGWNSQCSGGTLIKSAQAWGDQARSYYPGYAGPYPKMAIWHGTTDTTLAYPNLGEALKQWSNVHGVAFTRNVTNTPDPNYTRMEYGDGSKVLGFSAQGVGHSVPVHLEFDLAWFGLTGTSPTATGSAGPASSSIGQSTTMLRTTTTTTTQPAPPSTTTGAPGGTIPKWGQCGGASWTGSGTCVAGTTCKYSNQWYSQCL